MRRLGRNPRQQSTKENNMSGLIEGKREKDGQWGRVTVRTDGSILLENVELSDIDIRKCELIAESGENPIPFADRMNRLQDFAGDGHEAAPDNKLFAGHAHDYRPVYSNEKNCALCGKVCLREKEIRTSEV
jgi:hypothetical protein